MPAVFSKCVFISGTASYIVFTSALIYRNIEHKPRARTARCRLSSRCSKPVGASSWNLPWLLKTNQTKNLKCNTERALKLQGVTGFPHPAPHYCSCDRGPIPTEPHGHMAAPHIYRAWWRYPKLSIPIQHPEICFIYRNVYNGSDKNPAPHSCQGLGRRVGTATGGPVLQDVGGCVVRERQSPFLEEDPTGLANSFLCTPCTLQLHPCSSSVFSQKKGEKVTQDLHGTALSELYIYWCIEWGHARDTPGDEAHLICCCRDLQ